jgi:ribose 5-phosphate isomerase B
MPHPSDSDLQKIVEQVVQQTMGRAEASPGFELAEDAFLPPHSARETLPAEPVEPADGPIAIGADHGGYPLKEFLKAGLIEQGYNVLDCGTHSTDSVDYPDFASAVARLVSEAEAWRGIIVDGAGIGSCMVANKWPGVRAALCYDHATAVNSREHNNANVLTLGAGLIGQQLARQIVTTWLATPFGGGRHARRVDKINALESRWNINKS